MIGAIVEAVAATKEVAAGIESCRISLDVMADMKEMLKSLTGEVSDVSATAAEGEASIASSEAETAANTSLEANAEYVKSGHFYETNETGIINKVDGIEKNETGERIYRDDNGNVYRVGDNLEPNKSYEVNGYKYQTDDLGRTISAEGKLRLVPKHERRMDDMDAIGKGHQLEGDHRGHTIAHQFGGSGGIENVTPMNGELNTGAYKAMENRLADAVKDGADVKLKVEPKYEGDIFRPTEYKATYTIDNEKEVVIFRNQGLEAEL